jgi:GntR family transcriptional regulator
MRTFLYQTLADDLRRKIKDGEYRPGSKLPSRRELRQTLGVSDAVISRAMWILKQDGLVEPRMGSGSYVVDVLPAG